MDDGRTGKPHPRPLSLKRGAKTGAIS